MKAEDTLQSAKIQNLQSTIPALAAYHIMSGQSTGHPESTSLVQNVCSRIYVKYPGFSGCPTDERMAGRPQDEEQKYVMRLPRSSLCHIIAKFSHCTYMVVYYSCSRQRRFQYPASATLSLERLVYGAQISRRTRKHTNADGDGALI
jgi:hypothetical protein